MSDSLENPMKQNKIDVFKELEKINPTLYDIFEKAAGILIRKNHDYAGKNDFYKNFRKSERTNVPAWQGIFIRFQDKVSRLEQFIATGEFKVITESFEDTVIDGMNYLALMLACYKDDKKKKHIMNFDPDSIPLDERHYYKSVDRDN